MKRSIFFSLALFSMAMFLTVGLSAAAPEKDPEKAPPLKEKEKPKSAPDKMPDKAKLFPPLSKEVPESIEDLRAIEMQVQKVLDKVLPCTVCVLIGAGSGSGVIVTAGRHCADGRARIEGTGHHGLRRDAGRQKAQGQEPGP